MVPVTYKFLPSFKDLDLVKDEASVETLYAFDIKTIDLKESNRCPLASATIFTSKILTGLTKNAENIWKKYMLLYAFDIWKKFESYSFLAIP